MKLTKVHRIPKFKQSDWLKNYIGFNPNKRKNVANGFEWDFFKLMETMENLGKRVIVKLVNNAKDYIRYIRKPGLALQKIFSENFVAIQEIKPVLTFNKPIYVGFSILDLSKLLMYEFHYKYIKGKINANLLFTDKFSLV